MAEKICTLKKSGSSGGTIQPITISASGSIGDGGSSATAYIAANHPYTTLTVSSYGQNAGSLTIGSVNQGSPAVGTTFDITGQAITLNANPRSGGWRTTSIAVTLS